MRDRIKKTTVVMLSAFLILASLAGVFATPSFADEGLLANTHKTRIGGMTRYGTSQMGYLAMASMKQYGYMDAVVIASGVNFPDALSAAYLAHKKGAALLLTDKDDSQGIASIFLASRNFRGNVYVVGGTSAISDNTAALLRTATGNWKSPSRVSGGDRYATNLAVIKAAGGETSDLLVCSGNNFADALSASGIPLPILLVGSDLSQDQINLLSKNTNRNIYIVGGTSVVNSTVESKLQNYGNVVRIGGKDRYETSKKLAEYFYGSNGTIKQTSGVVLAQGSKFPDGLVAGPIAMKKGFPVLLADSSNSSQAKSFVTNNKAGNCIIMGGESAVPASDAGDVMTWYGTGSEIKPSNQVSSIYNTVVKQKEKLPGDVSNRKKQILKAAIGYVKNPTSDTNSNCYRLVVLSYNAAKLGTSAYKGKYWDIHTNYFNVLRSQVGSNQASAVKQAVQLPLTSSGAEPGDIIEYTSHVAIYIGNKMAIHGNWQGRTVIGTMTPSYPRALYFWHTDV